EDEVLAAEESVEYELTPLPAEEREKQPDLTTPLLGLSAGDAKTFAVTYPAGFRNERFAGKEITFAVEVSGVKIKELDPLDDEFAQTVGDFETLAELKESIFDTLEKQRQQQLDLELGHQMLDKAIAGVEKLEWPLVAEEEEIDNEIERAEQRLKNMGLTLEGYLQMEHKTRENWRAELRPGIIERLKHGLVLGKIAQLEGLAVSQGEILQQAKVLADYSGGGDRLWRSILSSETQQSMIANDVLTNKALLRLAAIARGEAPESGAELAAAVEDGDAGEGPAPTETGAAAPTSADAAQTQTATGTPEIEETTEKP
ncbi:MAG: hypothetical protein AB1801_25230, partial [Chloroflexota bacterium]